MILSIDIETYSSVDLRSTGVYPYIASPDFQILMLAYSIDGGEVDVFDLTFDPLPEVFVTWLLSPNVTKTAWNAAFERLCLSKYLGVDLPVEQWDCSMIRGARAGYPLQLGLAAKAMGLEQEKDTAGKNLIKHFSVPCKPTKTNGGRTRNLPEHDREKWAQYIEYNRQDVVVEMAIRERIVNIPVTEFEQRLYCLDQKINDMGILVDVELALNAIEMQETYVSRITQEASELTGLDNPNSVKQLLAWLDENGQPSEKLRKSDVSEMLDSKALTEKVRRALEIRQEASKSSVKKYQAMLNYLGEDQRVRGLFQFYGANRTGRWAGRGIQLQNLPQNHLAAIEVARRAVKSGNAGLLSLLYRSIPDTLSQLIRTAFIPKEGHVLIISDFSAIEARVLAWLAGEQWRLDVFKTHGKIYEASASQMFKIPIEEITKGSPLRQKGKVSELALGYQGGPNALITMGALKQGLTEDELPSIVSKWRKASPAIVRLWADLEAAAIEAIERPGYWVKCGKFLRLILKQKTLFIELPSGRMLSYLNATLKPSKYGNGKMSIAYQGLSQEKKVWGHQDTYGGKLTENVVQAIARDCLAEALIRLDDAGYTIVTHVHDEVVLEEPEDRADVEKIDKIMSTPMPWAADLPLKAEGFIAKFYQK
ncbi:hypothetical protein BWI93_05215 [Siphonobacter sp. BAB-5385]|uniref:DNA polymerase n=1 Tax=Siphonobacter sp. BAB-5385 TaxID=1864822 RepID=UPI000B9E0865|nr:DNA polymerase [Siphonobacter sp. BAB-5385]OZI09206.1 hypothetical protein BWI93_05215 [Siphonobacter sp. BAB-5385]